jgi:hypothetical protein
MELAVRQWKLIHDWKNKRQGQVWVVEDQNSTRGYFKFSTKKQYYFSGPMIANEYIAAALARKLGFPVADLKMATVVGADGRRRRGVVSIAKKACEVLTWHDADAAVYDAPEQHVEQTDLLAMLIVFDAWIANIDRATGKNLILYRNDRASKYKWYLIDHGHCLYGSPRKWKRGAWNAPIWEQVWRFYHVPKGLLRLQSSRAALHPMIAKIEALTEADLDDALNSVPTGHLSPYVRRFTKRLLLHRQKKLRSIIERWLKSDSKVKEYNRHF